MTNAALGAARGWARGSACALAAVLVVAAGGTDGHASSGSARAAAAVTAFFQQGGKLTGGGESGNGQFGYSVALSGDGETALVGGPNDDASKGAAWIFTRSGTTWSQQGGNLTGSGEAGAGRFGYSVGLSSDGNTGIVGGPNDATQKGAAWVFTRSGSAWNQQGNKLTGTGETGAGRLGSGVALSADGNTAAVGAEYDDLNKGAVFVFTRSGTTWAQQGNKLVGTGGTTARVGISVALSTDGNTALAGGPTDASQVGAAWVFTRSGTTWTQQGGKLTGAGEIGMGLFGSDVALSGDGNTALVGGMVDDAVKGAAWVFTRAGTTWTQQGNKLTATGVTSTALLGSSVALASDGNTAVLGAPYDTNQVGAALVFTRSGSTWTQLGSKLTGDGETGNGRFGGAVALAADGKTALVGGYSDSTSKGAAWVFSGAPPAVSGLSPASGPAGGGTLVKVAGSNLTGASAVKFGGVDATLIKVISEGEISAVSPAGKGTVDVLVTTPTGTSSASAGAQFTYTGGTVTPNPIVARIVYATVLQKKGVRTLDIRIRVNMKATAKVRLLRYKLQKLVKTFAVKGGTNELKATIPRSLTRGSHQVVIALSDGKGHTRIYRTSVLVPART